MHLFLVDVDGRLQARLEVGRQHGEPGRGTYQLVHQGGGGEHLLDVVEDEQGISWFDRLDGECIKACPGKMSRAQGIDKSILNDEAATGGVDQDRARFHSNEAAAVNHPARRRIEVNMQ